MLYYYYDAFTQPFKQCVDSQMSDSFINSFEFNGCKWRTKGDSTHLCQVKWCKQNMLSLLPPCRGNRNEFVNSVFTSSLHRWTSRIEFLMRMQIKLNWIMHKLLLLILSQGSKYILYNAESSISTDSVAMYAAAMLNSEQRTIWCQ